MDESKKSSERDETLRALTEADAENAKLQKSAQELLENVTQDRDRNSAFTELVKIIPEDAVLKKEDWKAIRATTLIKTAAAKEAYGSLSSPLRIYVSAVASNAVVTSITAIAVVSSSQAKDWKHEDWYDHKFLPRLQTYNEVTNLSGEMEKVEGLLVQFALDKDAGVDKDGHIVKNPLERLREAHAALNRANTETASANAILIPMRESILGVISQLYARKPLQDQGRGTERHILSIAQQCRRDQLSPQYFEIVAAKAKQLTDQAGDLKGMAVPRGEALAFFIAGVSVIKAILEGLDEGTFKKA